MAYATSPRRGAGQKTGAFLDQRENRALVGRIARGARARLLQLPRLVRASPGSARRARHGTRLLGRTHWHAPRRTVARNGLDNVDLRGGQRVRIPEGAANASASRFDTIVLDPPAFAKTRPSLAAALRGYKEINLRAMRLLTPGGLLFTASCSYHLTQAALPGDARSSRGRQRSPDRSCANCADSHCDHPEVLTIPETGYIKGALLEAAD